VRVILASASGDTAAFLVIGVLGGALSAAVYLLPGVFDAATRARLRMQGLPDDERVISRDRDRRRFIALVLGIISAAMLITALVRL
jgi:hypothetical protein